MVKLSCLIELRHSSKRTRIELEVYEAGTGRLVRSERMESIRAKILEVADKIVLPLEVTAITLRLVLRECDGEIKDLGERIALR